MTKQMKTSNKQKSCKVCRSCSKKNKPRITILINKKKLNFRTYPPTNKMSLNLRSNQQKKPNPQTLSSKRIGNLEQPRATSYQKVGTHTHTHTPQQHLKLHIPFISLGSLFILLLAPNKFGCPNQLNNYADNVWGRSQNRMVNLQRLFHVHDGKVEYIHDFYAATNGGHTNFGNDSNGTIRGYSVLKNEKFSIQRVAYVEGLKHNLVSVKKTLQSQSSC